MICSMIDYFVAIRIVTCSSDFPIVEYNEKHYLLPPLGTDDLVITVTVESTIVDAHPLDSCPIVEWQINGIDIVDSTVYTNPCTESKNAGGIHVFTLTIPTFSVETSGKYSANFSIRGHMASKEIAVTYQGKMGLCAAR